MISYPSLVYVKLRVIACGKEVIKAPLLKNAYYIIPCKVKVCFTLVPPPHSFI